jgi:hypothetical protein
MFFATEKTAGALQRFAARNVNPATRAGDHRFARGLGGGLAALAREAAHEEVDDGYGDDEK